MSFRGRGCVEVKASPNPFFQTTANDIGVNANNQVEWKINGKVPPFAAKPYIAEGNFSFLYTRESDVIGSKVPKPNEVDKKKMLTKTEFLKKKREMFEATKNLEIENSFYQSDEKNESTAVNAEMILKVYKHEPKQEDPRYITSNCDYGRKAPSVATVVVDRQAIPQAFSSSFNNIKPKNTALTTSLTRSNVHPSLDPQFA